MSINNPSNNHEQSTYTLNLLPESDSGDTSGDTEAKRSHWTSVWSILTVPILTRCWELLYKYFITACWHSRRYKLVGGTETDSGVKAERAVSMSTRDIELKKRLQDHFRGHIQKWMDRDHPRFPWKAALHILLVGIVTAQVC